MQTQLRLSLETGKIEVPGVPGEAASEDERQERTLALCAAVSGELPDLEARAPQEPREVLKRLWVLNHCLQAFPAKWIRNFALRHEWNQPSKRLEDIRILSCKNMDEGVGQKVWEELDYVRGALPLLYDKFKVRGDVMRLILSPLGKLAHAQIRYQRDDADDLPRVCREIREEIRRQATIDSELARWGEENYAGLLRPGSRPVRYPAGMIDDPTLGLGSLGLGLALDAAAGGLALDANLRLGLGVVGGLATLFGAFRTWRWLQQRREGPRAFADLSLRLREYLYLICCLRVLDRMAARYNKTAQDFDAYLNANGGKNRWKDTKFEQRDLTQVMVEGSEEWHPKETVEHWMQEQVKQVFRMESTALTPLEQVDPDAWDVILRAYLLETLREEGVDAELLDTVADLLFVREGEDTAAERKRVFDRVYKAWDDFVSGRGR